MKDEAAILTLLQRGLTEEGFAVDVASNALLNGSVLVSFINSLREQGKNAHAAAR